MKSLAIRKISEILFQNIPKVKTTYEQALGKKLKIDISRVNKIAEIRRHIVHRNGMTLDGASIVVTTDDLSSVTGYIKEFSVELQTEINEQLNA